MVELAKVTSKGQITIPIAIRRALNVREGDKVLFSTEGSRVYLMNASVNALAELQAAFTGTAEKLGLQTEEDVVQMVKEFRQERLNTP